MVLILPRLLGTLPTGAHDATVQSEALSCFTTIRYHVSSALPCWHTWLEGRHCPQTAAKGLKLGTENCLPAKV